MEIFQDIKVKKGKYGYFPGSGKVAPVPCPHPPGERASGALYPTK